MYHYVFAMTIRDRLDAFEAHWTLATGMRRWARGGLIGCGWAFVTCSACALAGVGPSIPLLQMLVWFPVGLGILYVTQVRPMMYRRQIPRNHPAQQLMEIYVDGEGIRGAFSGVGDFRFLWEEICGAYYVRRGMSVSLACGHAFWLPNRAFRRHEEKAELYEYIEEKRAR